MSVSPGVVIHRASPQDAQQLSEIAFAAKAYWGYPEQWMKSWRYSLTIEPQYIENNQVFVLEGESGAIGFYGLTGQPPILVLDHLWVVPDKIGQGYGRILTEHAEELARNLGAETLEIQADPHAEPFYLHMGAKRVGEYVYELDGQLRILPKLVISLK